MQSSFRARTKRVVLAGEDDDALGRGHRLKDRDQVLRCARCAGSKFKVAIASVERTGRVKRVVSRAGINSRDAYPKCRDGKPDPKQYVRNAPVGKADRIRNASGAFAIQQSRPIRSANSR